MPHLAVHTYSPDWQLRITDRDGAALHGAAVLVTPHHVVTCAHVIRDAVGGAVSVGGGGGGGGGGAGPGSTVYVDAPRGGDGWSSTATVVPGGWWWGTAPPWDVAVLRLDRPAPAPPARLADPPRAGDRVRLLGFTRSPAGRWVTGRVAGPGGSRPEYVQIDTDSASGTTVARGFSGSGVREKRDDDALVGIVCEAAAGGRVGWMIPMEAVPRVWEPDPSVTPPEPGPASLPHPPHSPHPPRGASGRRAIAATSLAMAELDTLLSPDQRFAFHSGLDRRLRVRLRLDQDPRSFSTRLVTLAHQEYGILGEILDLLDEWEEGGASMRRVRDAAAPLLERGIR